MASFTISFSPEPEREHPTVEAFLADWDRRQHEAAGSSYVYAFRDAAGSVFYIGKGQGARAHEADNHRHGRLGYYVTTFLSGVYTVEVLRGGLSNSDAEWLETELIETFGRQLVNWKDSFGTTLTADSVDQMRRTAGDLRERARAAAREGRLDEAASLCREALAYLSDWERTQHETETRELEHLAADSLPARVDLRRAQSEYVPYAPVLACEVFSDLTRYLCGLGRPEEARREVDTFTERYPHGSFRDSEYLDHRYGQLIRATVTQREQATLRRIERALSRLSRAPAAPSSNGEV